MYIIYINCNYICGKCIKFTSINVRLCGDGVAQLSMKRNSSELKERNFEVLAKAKGVIQRNLKRKLCEDESAEDFASTSDVIDNI